MAEMLTVVIYCQRSRLCRTFGRRTAFEACSKEERSEVSGHLLVVDFTWVCITWEESI
jgi:hypothetical protein